MCAGTLIILISLAAGTFLLARGSLTGIVFLSLQLPLGIFFVVLGVTRLAGARR